ncbi:hypothetical protein [Paraburkholderia sp. CI3]|uniref:hypothetical protein n=1 Tax=Paraburkholderia sp. CI3 TaxID=2991060 RepID=UPI003D1ACF43
MPDQLGQLKTLTDQIKELPAEERLVAFNAIVDRVRNNIVDGLQEMTDVSTIIDHGELLEKMAGTIVPKLPVRARLPAYNLLMTFQKEIRECLNAEPGLPTQNESAARRSRDGRPESYHFPAFKATLNQIQELPLPDQLGQLKTLINGIETLPAKERLVAFNAIVDRVRNNIVDGLQVMTDVSTIRGHAELLNKMAGMIDTKLPILAQRPACNLLMTSQAKIIERLKSRIGTP